MIVTDEDGIGGAGDAGDAPGIDVDQRVAEDGETAVSQPLNLIDHKAHSKYFRTKVDS